LSTHHQRTVVTEPTVPDDPDAAEPDSAARQPVATRDAHGEAGEPALDGPYRVLASTRDRDEWLFIDPAGDPTYVPREGHGDLTDQVSGLRPGYRVDADFEWTDGTPVVRDLEVLERTLFTFVPAADPVFEAAQSCWEAARREGAPMNSRVTYTTEGDPAGVVYVFAGQPGQRNLFEEFRDGVKPLDPLVDRLADGEDPPFEAFVLDAADSDYVVVYLVVEKGGMVADTVRDTYDVPRPAEPLFEDGDTDGSEGATTATPAVGDEAADAADGTDTDDFDLGDALRDLPSEDE
jgi:hypothetical protein